MSTALSDNEFSETEFREATHGEEVGRSEPVSEPERRTPTDLSKVQITPPMQAGLSACFEAYAYARSLNRELWDFAVEISVLRQVGLSRSDLRWIVGKGLLEHAIETSRPGDAMRSFQRPSRLLFCRNTCFVLAQDCIELASKCSGSGGGMTPGGTASLGVPPFRVPSVVKPAWQETSPEKTAPERGSLVPKWDRDRQMLRIGRAVVKHFKVPASNQEMVLAAFEEEAWPPRIDDPLPPRREQAPKRRLRETIKSLNRNQKQGLIRFIGDGSGQGVRWELCNENQLAC